MTKTRIITVRLSDEEYERFQTATYTKGYRTMSELARVALQAVVADDIVPHHVLAQKLDAHEARLEELTREMTRIQLILPTLERRHNP